MSADQCIERYPDLYYEADRAKKFYRRGISESMVDEADRDGASARLAIIDNKVSTRCYSSFLGLMLVVRKRVLRRY